MFLKQIKNFSYLLNFNILTVLRQIYMSFNNLYHLAHAVSLWLMELS